MPHYSVHFWDYMTAAKTTKELLIHIVIWPG